MFEGLFGSLIGKILAIVTGLAGVVTGLAVTDAIPLEIPGIESTNASVSATANTPAGNAGASVSTPDLTVAQEAAAEQAQEQAVAIADQALGIVADVNSQAAAAKTVADACVASVTDSVTKLTAKIPGIATPAAAQALVAEAGAIGTAAQQCVAEAGKLGQTAVDLAKTALQQVTQAAGLLNGLGLPTGIAGDKVDAAVAATDAATGIADDAMKLALSIADKVTKMATGAVGDSMGIQQAVLEAALKAANTATGVAGSVSPVPLPGTGTTGGTGLPGLPSIPGVGSLPIPGIGGATGNPAQLGLGMAQMGMGLASSIMNQFLGGMGGGGIPGVGSLPIPGIN